MHMCLNCGKETSNVKYCSRSCSVSDTNKKYCRVKPRVTRMCNEPGYNAMYFVREWSKTRCRDCHPVWKNRGAAVTLGELKERLEVRGVHPSHRWSEVRQHCRNVANKHREKKCQVCGYSYHVDFCHIKALASWPNSATVAEVNAPSNILILCKNHHWELDNGFLKYRDGKFVRTY